MPGRKTDVRDYEWLVDLLCHGLLRPSFIPPLEVREIRGLKRERGEAGVPPDEQRERVLEERAGPVGAGGLAHETDLHTRQTYLAAQVWRLVRTKGQKRALVAVGHSILMIAYHVLKRRACYDELGRDYFDRQSTEHLHRRLIRRLERMWFKVIVEPVAQTA